MSMEGEEADDVVGEDRLGTLSKMQSEGNMAKANHGASLSFAEAAADSKTKLLRRGVTEPNLTSNEPVAASQFDVLFGRMPSEEFRYQPPKKAASAFDVLFGGSATVADGADTARIPDPSDPIDVVPPNESAAANNARSRSRPENLQTLVIPEEKAEDPSDCPEHVDRKSPTTLLEETVLHEAAAVPA
eukprot:CAMPEP_0196720488 /NCGR_PEP_ID=MMETSP1091-20130531/3275_1 /TAXON_ID=302021 /ORGANISM="Rhodomonas sp., Strain CCMP768" /LENGTH=187 /DNA_ID=CAMNT_0042061741 /DNA_START=42 /DNA_END=605 /DNA_ORIENTATION=+